MNPHLYTNDNLGFSVQKPEHWTFIPTAWALNFRRQLDPSNEELTRVMQLASVPFVYAQLPHSDPTSAFPTLQASCRALSTDPEPQTLLGPMLEQLHRQFADLEVLEASADAVIAGCPALRLKTKFSIQNQAGDKFHCLSHSYTLLAKPFGFSVGISCAAEGEYCVPEDLASIALSLRVRRRS